MNTTIYDSFLELEELEEILSSINEMQDKILDIYSSDSENCSSLLKNLSLLKEETEVLQENFKAFC
jgi:hypothetical protein